MCKLAVRVARAVKMGRVAGDRLARGRASQQAGEDRQVLESWNQFFDSHAGDVNLRQRNAKVCIALVGADHQAARFGDGKIDTGDPDLTSQGTCCVGVRERPRSGNWGRRLRRRSQDDDETSLRPLPS